MAVTLNIDLSDTEQAKLSEVAKLVAPDATAAQIKAWAESEAKAALRAVVMERAVAARREAENVARRTADEADAAAWPEPVAAG